MSFQAHSVVCSKFLKNETIQILSHSDQSTVSLYEASRLAALDGDISQSILLNEEIRNRISSLKIVKVYKKEYGSHGAYMAKLEDGTDVLIKPHSEDWYSSIPKEVGVSIFADAIGLPIVPVAGYRLDTVSNSPASVHLIVKVDSLKQKWSEFQAIMKMIKLKGSLLYARDRSEVFGSEIAFLMGIVGYSFHEAKPRHVLNQSIGGVKVKSLIDLGSAFIDSAFTFNVDEAPFVMLSEASMKQIENIGSVSFHSKLTPYFPDSVIEALLQKTQLSVQAMRAHQSGDPSELSRVRSLISKHRAPLISQKWKWTEASGPPQMAIDFGI